MADNTHFDMTGVYLELALNVAFGKYHKAYGWSIQGEEGSRRMILHWCTPSDMQRTGYIPFPTPLGAADVLPLVKNWLETVDYGPEPDHDGDNGKGWRVYNEAWSHIGNDYTAFVAIEPVWLMYGK